MKSRRAFTLIEVLVVAAIVALLVAILLPSLRSARAQARRVVCAAQLHQVGRGLMSYTSTFRDLLPDPYILGRHALRQVPGTLTPGDPSALPERYGLAAALTHRAARAMPRETAGWVCPDAAEWMRRGGNSYAFAFNHPGYNFTTSGRKNYWDRSYTTVKLLSGHGGAKYVFAWDNYNFRYGLTGFLGPWTGYSIAGADQVFPHALAGNVFAQKHRMVNGLYLDLHVAPRKLE